MLDIEEIKNTIICGDCLEVMQEIPDNCIDLIVTSPPYNLGKKHHTGNKTFNSYNEYNDNLPENDYQKWQTNILNEIYRITKESGSLIYNHKNRIRNGVQISPYEWIFKSNWVIKQEIIWFNGSQNFDKCRFYPMTERIYWLAKSPKTKLINTINHHDLFGRDEWKAEGTKKEHKRSFPEKMVMDFLKCFPKANLIFDPFSGSGTTAVACKQLNRNFIGIELSPEYCKIAEERLKNA